MVDFDPTPKAVERMRDVTSSELAREILTDDNDLLSLLRAADFLIDDALTGYLPAALFIRTDGTTGEGGEAEIFVDKPLGPAALTTNGGARYNYQSPHARLVRFFEEELVYSPRNSYETGHLVETSDKKRLLLAKHEGSIDMKIRHGRFVGTSVLAQECERLGIEGLGQKDNFVHPDFRDVVDLRVTEALREAAKWMEYTLSLQYNKQTDDKYPRLLTVEEAGICLARCLQNIKNERPEWDSTVIGEVVGI